MARCKYGKLKHKIGNRRCKTKRHAKRHLKARKGSAKRRRSRKPSKMLVGVGVGVALVGAAYLLPKMAAGA